MCAVRGQNSKYPRYYPPSYYTNNQQYVASYGPIQSPTRVSRRIHDGLTIDRNYGLDTTADDINSSPYSSPYYINGRYNSDNLTTQRGNSASVQGCVRLLTIGDEIHDFTENDIQTTLEIWQGKQIKFEIPYDGKVVGNTITLRNPGHSTGNLSIYLSASDGGRPISETSIDLCKVSEDKFEHFTLYSNIVVPKEANTRGKLYVRMEIWGEVSKERSVNPFNTGKKVEIAATGDGSHEACVYKLTNKNTPANEEKYEYKPYPSRPLLGLIYNPWHSLPTNKEGQEKEGATIALNGYRYDLFTIQNDTETKMVIYDPAMNKTINNNIKIDGRANHVNLVQVDDKIYYVDGFSPLQKFTIGQWTSSEVHNGSATDDTQPVIGASLIFKCTNRVYLGGFRFDRNLMQVSMIDESGPLVEVFYRFYAPDQYPEEVSINPITALESFTTDGVFIGGENFLSQFVARDLEGTSGAAKALPQQEATFADGIGVRSQGDIVNFKGTLYSFDPDEGLRYYTGSVWRTVAGTNDVDSLYDRVDMDKPRKLWGYAKKLYFNYTDKIDGKAKCLVVDFSMNYQQYPVFQDVDIPFCDVRIHDDFELIGIHPDYPCIMKLYAEDTWRRLDSPIEFERDTKHLSVPGNMADMIVKRAHFKVLANADRYWYVSLGSDKQYQKQYRGIDHWYRQPVWATVDVVEPVEEPFPFEDVYEYDATFRCTLSHLRIQCSSIQMKVKCKTFRAQASLISESFEAQIRNYN